MSAATAELHRQRHGPAVAVGRTRIELCGSLVAEIDGRRIEPLLTGRRGRHLFACLVLDRRRPISRDHLIDAIWHDDQPADPDAALATLLARLRAAIGHERLVGRHELMLVLGDDARVDWEVAHDGLDDAERLLAEGDPEGALARASEALEITRRPLLPGLSSPWVEARRRELADAATALLETGARAALAAGGENVGHAERWARELIKREPFRESGYRVLMESHAQRGNVAEALLVFDMLRRLLREELGLTPGPELQGLADTLLAVKDAPPPPAASPLPAALAAATARPLIGRRAELRTLTAAINERRRVVAVTGEPGVGKTRLVAEAAARARRAGVTVLHGCAQRDGAVPFEPLVDALRGHFEHGAESVRELLPRFGPELAGLASLVPALRALAGTQAPQPHQVRDAMAALLDDAGRRRRLLLVLEDLQWADAETLLAVRHLVRVTQLTVLVTVRDDEPQDPNLRTLLLDLHRERALEYVTLGGLDHAETAELLGEATITNRVRSLYARSGGNPFYLEELLAIDAGEPAFGLRAALDARLDGLREDVREALTLCAGEGPWFDLVAVACAAGVSRRSLTRAITDAVRAGLVVADEEVAQRFTFRHGIVWQAVLEQS